MKQFCLVVSRIPLLLLMASNFPVLVQIVLDGDSGLFWRSDFVFSASPSESGYKHWISIGITEKLKILVKWKECRVMLIFSSNHFTPSLMIFLVFIWLSGGSAGAFVCIFFSDGPAGYVLPKCIFVFWVSGTTLLDSLFAPLFLLSLHVFVFLCADASAL